MTSLNLQIDNTRFENLDQVRGVALLGILFINIYGFSIPDAARATPLLIEATQGFNTYLWALLNLFVDSKFIALFGLAFGASIWLFHFRTLEAQSHQYLYWRRSFWLLVFGLLHAYFLWFGDILTLYAIHGMIAWWWRRWSNGALMLAIALLVLIPQLLIFAGNLVTLIVFGDSVTDIYSHPEPDVIAAQIAHYHQDWLNLVRSAAEQTTSFQLSQILLDTKSLAMMLSGILITRKGFLEPDFPRRRLIQLSVIAIGSGMLITGISLAVNFSAGFPAHFTFGFGYQLHALGALPMAVGYFALGLWWSQTNRLINFKHRLAQLGRCTLSGYIMQSLVFGFAFYGFGLGLYGQLQLWQVLLMVIATWGLQLWLANWWLARYRLGPLEWVWRSLAYCRLQSFARENSC